MTRPIRLAVGAIFIVAILIAADLVVAGLLITEATRKEGRGLSSGFLLSGGFASAAGIKQFLAVPPASGVGVIQGVRIVHGDGRIQENATITISDDTITSVKVEGCVHPGAAWVIDGRGKTAIAGLIDAHVHLFPPKSNLNTQKPQHKLADVNLFNPTLRRKFLQSGITTVRSMGDPVELVKQLKQQIEDYVLGGPGVFYAGKMITAPGGHPVSLYPPEDVAKAVAEVATISEAESVVDAMRDEGAQVIKVIYGSATLNGEPAPHLKKEILEAIVERAHNALQPIMVAAHIETLQRAAEAIQVGVDAIEHIPGNAEGLARLAGDRGIFVTPTLRAPFGMLPAEVFETIKRTMRAFHQDGRALIVTGTDYPFAPAGTGFFDEMELMQDCGMEPVEILQAATMNAARALGQEDRLGTIATDHQADIILLECDPLQDIACLREKNKIVLQKGRVVFAYSSPVPTQLWR